MDADDLSFTAPDYSYLSYLLYHLDLSKTSRRWTAVLHWSAESSEEVKCKPKYN